MALSTLAPRALATTCELASEMDESTQNALGQAASRYLELAVTGDVAGLRAAAIPSLAGNFSGIETAVVQHQDALKADKAIRIGTYLLEPKAQRRCRERNFIAASITRPSG